MASVMTPEKGLGTAGPTITIQRVVGVCFGAVLTVDRIIHPVVVGKNDN